MKKILTIAFAVLAITSFAQEAKDIEAIKAEAKADAVKAVQAAKVSNKRAEMESRPEVLRKTGGFIDVAAEGIAIVCVDTRKTTGAACDQFSEVFKNFSHMNVAIEKTPLPEGECAVAFAAKRLAATSAAFALVVTECEKTATLSVFPEDRIAVINAAKLKGGDDPLKPEVRVIKELWRGLGFVTGLDYAQKPNDVFQPVFSVAELDALEYQVMQPMHFQKMYALMARYGVKRARHIPYRAAVIEGWAAAPTNEVQKLVYEEAKAWAETNKVKKASAPAK